MKILKGFGKLLGASKKTKVRLVNQVAIFGYSDSTEKDFLYKNVVEVAKKLAEEGYTVVDGGGPGVMRAATYGAKLGGGRVIGVTLQSDGTTHFEGKDPRNLFDEEIKTSNYIERTLTLLKQGQVYVIFRGGTGTISEFGMAWGLARIYFGHHKPLILYGKFWEKIIKVFKDNMLLRPEELKVFKIVDSPEKVIKAIDKFEEEISKGEHKHLETSRDNFTI